jgi:hypothetical protein
VAVVGLEEAAAVGVEEIAADADGDATAGGDVGLEGCGGGDEAAEKTLPLLCWGAVSLALATDCCSPLSLTGVPSSYSCFSFWHEKQKEPNSDHLTDKKME